MSNKQQLIESIVQYAGESAVDRKLLETKSLNQLQDILADAWTKYKEEQEDEVLRLRAETAAQQAITALHFQELQESRRPQAEQKQRESEAADRKTFADAARKLRSFGQTEANLNVIRLTLGAGFTVFDIENAVAAGTVQLSPATPQELQKWQIEDQRQLQEQQEQRQSYLINEASPEELRAAQRQEAVQARKTAAQVQFEYELVKGYERDVIQGGMPPLPATWDGQVLDASFIKKASREVLSRIMRKHGSSQLTARLHNVKKATNDQGREYSFE